MRYFPFFRGKQNELLALRDLATSIVNNGNVIPILEAVNSNSTTRISIDQFMAKSMKFLFICNPMHGDFSDNADRLAEAVISQGLSDYDNWIPALYVDEATALQQLEAFIETYNEYKLALVYCGKPQRSTVCSKIDATDIEHHVFMDGRVENDYIESIPINNRVIIADPFKRKLRNADYPPQEFFTDRNTVAGNKDNVDFGDFSIVGDYYTETGGPAHAVALHHIHFKEDSKSLYISHFLSDRIDTTVDTPGKIIEAVKHLVEAMDKLQPNETQACAEYITMSKDLKSHGLGYMKRLSIKHHLEVMLSNGGLAN